MAHLLEAVLQTDEEAKGLKRTCPQRVKVLFFISSLEGGGAERVMVDILSQMDKKRIEPVLVLLYPYETSPYRKHLPEEIKIIVVGKKKDDFFGKMGQFINFIKTVRGEKPQVILSMLTHNNIMAVVAGLILRIRVIVCEHSTLGEVIKTEEGEKMLGIPTAFLVKLFYGFAHRIIAVSEGIRTNLIEEFHITASRIKVIYNPLDLYRITELSSISPQHPFFEGPVPLIIAAGRLVRIKGFDTLVRAFSMVVQEMDARLMILGEGPEREPLQQLAKALAVECKVSFPGFQNNPYAFISGADVFVLSSLYEGLPMVILEAMACGTPVISTDCRSGPREILQDGRCGLLIPVKDERALSEGILRLLKGMAIREEFSRLGKRRAEDFSLSKIVEQYEGLIHETASLPENSGSS